MILLVGVRFAGWWGGEKKKKITHAVESEIRSGKTLYIDSFKCLVKSTSSKEVDTLIRKLT